MGFICPERQTMADFLTSLTSPLERIAHKGWEARVPQSPEEFDQRWLKSADHQRLVEEINAYNQESPIDDGHHLATFRNARRAQQAKHQRIESPYTISIAMQIKLCMRRAFWRLQGDMTLMLTGVIGNSIMCLIVASVFYNLENDTSSLFNRGALLFFSILLNAFSSMLEVCGHRLFLGRFTDHMTDSNFVRSTANRGEASKVRLVPPSCGSYCLYDLRSATEDRNLDPTNLIIYFMTNLRRTPEAFFTFFLFSFAVVLAMSMVFRSIGALSRTVSEAMAPSAVLILALVTYTGFTIPVRDMRPWFRWINYLNPVAYGFEALMINEFHNRRIPCTRFAPDGPGYLDARPDQRICSTTSASAGADFVDGDTFLSVNYQYSYSHLWR